MLIERYLLKNLTLATLFVAGSLTCVIWLTLLLGKLQGYIDSSAPFSLLLDLVLLSTPQFLEVILPLSVVIAILFTYNKMALDNEIAVMRSSGIDQLMLARPAFRIAWAVTAGMLCLTTWLTPGSFYRMHELKHSLSSDYSRLFIREGAFSSFGQSLTIYARKYRDDGTIEGLTIMDTHDKDAGPVTIIAREGRIEMQGETPVAVLYDGVRQQMDGKTHALSALHFSRYDFEIEPPASGPGAHWKTAEERTLPELLHPDGSAEKMREYHDAFLAEAHRRLVMPFSTLTFCAIAAAVMLLGPANRRGNQQKIALAVAIVAAIEVFDLSIANAAKKNLALAPLLYAATLLPLGVALFSLQLRGEQWLIQRRRSFARWRMREAF